MNSIPTLKDIREAVRRIAPYAHITPILTNSYFNKLTHAQLYFKCENFQKAGAFKFRGACNAVMFLTDKEAKRGVATHSSGNHGAALSLAAKNRGMDAHIVVPSNVSNFKIKAVQSYGGKIRFCEPSLKARESTLSQLLEETGAIPIHPYNDPKVIAGQATAALELLANVPNLGMIITPVGGGGLLSGSAIVVKEKYPHINIIGVEPEGADDAFRSFSSGRLIPCSNPNTIADGLLASLGELTFSIITKYVDDIITVSDQSIIHAMRVVWERMKIIIEPSSAVVVAALLEQKIDVYNQRIGIILTGGNVDLGSLLW
ncbi:MAG: pyridoxal-phosphate dependent enzyme [Candidatus Marinimicrobia bacterium]|nr:pyridoxal-phosphate dependent enzyme [Candidatus Neomarinimicrobiota bacterium]